MIRTEELKSNCMCTACTVVSLWTTILNFITATHQQTTLWGRMQRPSLRLEATRCRSSASADGVTEGSSPGIDIVACKWHRSCRRRVQKKKTAASPANCSCSVYSGPGSGAVASAPLNQEAPLKRDIAPGCPQARQANNSNDGGLGEEEGLKKTFRPHRPRALPSGLLFQHVNSCLEFFKKHNFDPQPNQTNPNTCVM